MIEHKWVVRLLGVFAFTAACSNAPSKTDGNMTVQGTVSSALQANGAQAVAVGADGNTFWSALDTNGDFKLVVPTGQSYRVILAQQSNSGPVAIAFLTLSTSGGKTQWIVAKSTTTLRLGTLVPASMLASVQATAGAVKTQSDGTDTMAADGSGRGGSGRGGTDVSSGSGRGGDTGASTGDDDDDDSSDDAAHANDPPCHKGGIDDDKVCPASGGTTEMASSRDGASDVSDCGDSSKAGDNAAASCSAPPAAGAGGTSGTVIGAGPVGGSAGSSGAGASSGIVPPPAPTPAAPPPPLSSPGVN
jgi:hypothetical protein